MKEPIVPQFTGEEYLRWEEARPEKYELHHGFIVAFAGGTIAHDRVAFRLRTFFDRAFERPCETFGADVKIRIADETFFYADAGVVCEPVDTQDTTVARPTIVAEVLSRSTHAYDQVEKRAAYRTLSSLAAYVIVHADMRRVEVDERGPEGAWQTAFYDDDFAYIRGRTLALDDLYGTASGA